MSAKPLIFLLLVIWKCQITNTMPVPKEFIKKGHMALQGCIKTGVNGDKLINMLKCIPANEEKLEKAANAYKTYPRFTGKINERFAANICRTALSNEETKQNFPSQEKCMEQMKLCALMYKEAVCQPPTNEPQPQI
ncbi:uncharacterized protein LOC126834858 [Adelges cooleyi]|uniref:uncharacterized protein LOC126834858 n=1 Tax=Adelges cooleyi TaxID=133065 RepID=UPI0021800B99|nr:uncharacterized protein LOC126834858 [Adelges cooleyi]